MTRIIIGLLVLTLVACQDHKLVTGNWEGTLTPVNHPDQPMPIGYIVEYVGDDLELRVISPDGQELPTKNARVANRTVKFQFNEPEMGFLFFACLLVMGINTRAGVRMRLAMV